MLGRDVFIAMELVPGPTVTARLAQTPRTTDEILTVFLAAGAGLAAAHRAGLARLALGKVYKLQQVTDRAADYLRDAAIGAHAAGHDEAAAMAESALVLIHTLSAHYDEARRWAELAEATVERAGVGGYAEAFYLLHVAEHYNLTGDNERELEATLRGLAIYRRILPESDPRIVQALHAVGRAHLSRGDYEPARVYIEEAPATGPCARPQTADRRRSARCVQWADALRPARDRRTRSAVGTTASPAPAGGRAPSHRRSRAPPLPAVDERGAAPEPEAA